MHMYIYVYNLSNWLLYIPREGYDIPSKALCV